MKIEKYAVYALNETKNISGYVSDNTMSQQAKQAGVDLIFILPSEAINEDNNLIHAVITFFSKRKANDFAQELHNRISKQNSKDVITFKVKSLSVPTS